MATNNEWSSAYPSQKQSSFPPLARVADSHAGPGSGIVEPPSRDVAEAVAVSAFSLTEDQRTARGAGARLTNFPELVPMCELAHTRLACRVDSLSSPKSP